MSIEETDIQEPLFVAENLTTAEQKEKQDWWVLLILSVLMGFGSISTDIYLPAMPAISHVFGANDGMMEWTISGYLIGFSLGQLLWGVLGDRYGRRLPIALGIGLFIIGSAGCGLSTSVAQMIGWRIVQALGACAGVVLSRAMVRDLYTGERATQMMSFLIIIMALAPLVGPSAGGLILAFAGWKFIFGLCALIGLLTLVSLRGLPETLPASQRTSQTIRSAVWGYVELLKDRELLAYAGAGGFFYAGMFAYIAGTPFAYISYYHVPAQLYGLLFAAGIVGIMATNFLNTRLAKKWTNQQIMLVGTVGAAVTGAMVAFDAETGFAGLWGLVIPLFLFASMAGFIVANSITGVLARKPDRAGAASALVGAIQYGSGIVGSGLVGWFADGTPWPLGLVIFVSGIGAYLCARKTSAPAL